MKKIILCVVLVICSYWAIRPLVSPGYFPLHDDTQIERVIAMGRSLKEGQFPVRWVSDLGYGYGYPIYTFYGPLPYYVGGALYALGVPAVEATKLMFGIGLVLPSLLLALVLLPSFGVAASFVAGVVLLYAPYHAVEAYIRGSVGEYWVLIFWPLILFGILSKKRTQWVNGVGAVGVFGSIISHTLLGYATVLLFGIGYAFSSIVSVFRTKQLPKRFVDVSLFVLFGVAASSFFWLPAISQMNLTSVAGQVSKTADYHDHFVCLFQLWSMPWGFAGSSAGCSADGMSFMLGKVHIFLAVAAVLIAFVRKSWSPTFFLACGIAGVGVFFTLPVSLPLWQMLPMFSYIQYPWRFLTVAVFGMSILSAFFVSQISHRTVRVLISLGILLLCLVVYAKRFMPQYIFVPSETDLASVENIRWRASSVSDEYLPPALVRPTSKASIVFDTIPSSNSVRVRRIAEKSTFKEFIVEATSSSVLSVNLAWFPGWIMTVNGARVEPAVVHGLPQFELPAGLSTVVLKKEKTPVELAGDWISLITLVIGIGFYAKRKKTDR